MHAVTTIKIWLSSRRGRILFAAIVAVVLLASVIGSTTKSKVFPQMSYFTNATFKLMLWTKANEVVDPTGQRLWISFWPSGEKCVAGLNVPIGKRQIGIAILRWSWKEPNQTLEPTALGRGSS
jgi:hypothetical protein